VRLHIGRYIRSPDISTSLINIAFLSETVPLPHPPANATGIHLLQPNPVEGGIELGRIIYCFFVYNCHNINAVVEGRQLS